MLQLSFLLSLATLQAYECFWFGRDFLLTTSFVATGASFLPEKISERDIFSRRDRGNNSYAPSDKLFFLATSGKSGPKDQVALHYYYTSPSHWCTTHEVSNL